MRPKLVLLAALVGTLLGTSASIAIIASTSGKRGLALAKFDYGADLWPVSVISLIPIAVATFAAIFVYRHTARRRKLQAVLTGALVMILSALVSVAVALVF